jgi:hypothetical protein
MYRSNAVGRTYNEGSSVKYTEARDRIRLADAAKCIKDRRKKVKREKEKNDS